MIEVVHVHANRSTVTSYVTSRRRIPVSGRAGVKGKAPLAYKRETVTSMKGMPLLFA